MSLTKQNLKDLLPSSIITLKFYEKSFISIYHFII